MQMFPVFHASLGLLYCLYFYGIKKSHLCGSFVYFMQTYLPLQSTQINLAVFLQVYLAHKGGFGYLVLLKI